jgi:hypothetical protein
MRMAFYDVEICRSHININEHNAHLVGQVNRLLRLSLMFAKKETLTYSMDTVEK